MAVAFYMDVHVQKAITTGLLLLGVDVITAQQDNAARLPDPELLDRAMVLGRALFTFDEDFLVEADRRQSEGIEFAGVIYARPLRVSVSECIRDLEIIAKAGDTADLVNTVLFLPL